MQDQTRITYLAPPSTMAFIQTITAILDGLLTEYDKQIKEIYDTKEK